MPGNTQLASPPVAKRVPCPSRLARVSPLLRQARQSRCLALLGTLLSRLADQGRTQLRRVECTLRRRWSPLRAPTPTPAAPRLWRRVYLLVPSLSSECRVLKVVAQPLLASSKHVTGLCSPPDGAGQEAGQVTHVSSLLGGRVSSRSCVRQSAAVQRVRVVERAVLGLHAGVALSARRLEVDNGDEHAHDDSDGCLTRVEGDLT